MTRVLAAITVAALSSALGAPAFAADPLAAGDEVRRAVLEELTAFAEWQVGGGAITFGRNEVRRIGDFAHVRTVVTRAGGSPIDPDALVWIREASRPLTISGVLRHRDGRWMLLSADVEPAGGIDPDRDRRRWALPAGLLPPDCEHRQNWGCGGSAR